MQNFWRTASLRSFFEVTDEVCPISGETVHEERLNTLTHGAALVLGILGVIAILWYSSQCSSSWQIASSVVYGSTLIMVYGSSTLYHKCVDVHKKRRLKLADHISIYFFIAGSYTPFALSPCLGEWGWTIFSMIWGMAILGAVWKLIFPERMHIVSMIAYLAMGWLIVLALEPLFETLPFGGIAWMVTGGLMYTFGTIFYIWESLPFGHAIWHLCCLGGSVCHYCSILFYVLPL